MIQRMTLRMMAATRLDQEALRERKPEPITAAVDDERRHDADEQLQREIEHGNAVHHGHTDSLVRV